MGYDDKGHKLFVGNLSSKCEKEDLEKLFEPFGKIAEVKIKNKGGSNFFGFVEFDEERDASAALHKLHLREFMGKDIRIEFGRGGKRGTYREYDSRDSRYRDSRGLKRCYNCGSTRHKAFECRNSPGRSPVRRSRRYSYSRSRSRDRRRSRRSRTRSKSRDRKRRHRSRSNEKKKRDRSHKRDRSSKRHKKYSSSVSRSKSKESRSKSRSISRVSRSRRTSRSSSKSNRRSSN